MGSPVHRVGGRIAGPSCRNQVTSLLFSFVRRSAQILREIVHTYDFSYLQTAFDGSRGEWNSAGMIPTDLLASGRKDYLSG